MTATEGSGLMPLLNPKQNEYVRNATHRWNIKAG